MKLRGVHLQAGVLTIAFLLMVWGFQALLFTHAPVVFQESQEDLSYGWYVPLFSLYVLWTERRAWVSSLGAPSVCGAFATLPFLFLGYLGVRGIQIRFEMLAFIGLLIAVPWAVCGRETAKRMLFPAGFLLFCLPFATFLDVITVHLRLFATGSAYAILQGLGADIVRTGTMLSATDGSFAIDVAQPCSGLRSIFALMALTAGYAYFNQPTWFRRALLFACAIPLAIFGNVMRILTICLVGTFASPEFATGFYHDYSGYVVFAAAIALMVVCGEAITHLARRVKRDGSGSGSEGPGARAEGNPVKAGRSAFVVPVATLVALGVTMAVLAHAPKTVLCEPPAVALGELDGFASERVAASEAELTVLPADTQFVKRRYTAADGDWYSVSTVIGGESKSSIHRPELCLPAQGFLMADPHTVDVDGTSWRFIRLDGGVGRPSRGFAYTFANQAGFRTSSHVRRIFRDIWDRSFHGRIDRWVMVTVNASTADEESLKGFLRRLKGVVK